MIRGSALECCKGCDCSEFGIVFFYRATIRALVSTNLREREDYVRRSAFGE